jgi:hypothetical protein
VLKSLVSGNPILENGCDYNKKFYKDGILYVPYKFIVLEPGIYYLDQINLKSSYDFIRYYPAPGLRSNKLVYGGFEVKGGEILAIPLLDIDSKQGGFRLIDDFEEIKKDLEKSEYSYLVPKLKKGLFLKPGTIYFKGKFYNRKAIELENSMNKLCKEGILKKEYCSPACNSK